MEDSGLISEIGRESKVESISLTQIFEEQCPIYMSYGMTYDEYWYDSPYRAMFYRKAKEIQVKQKDEEFWMQGMYIYEALCDVSPILHAFCKSGTKPLPYSTKPYLSDFKNVGKTPEQIEQEAKQKVENERLIAQVQFKKWAAATARHFNKGKNITNKQAKEE